MARVSRFKGHDGVRRGWKQGIRSIDACTEGKRPWTTLKSFEWDNRERVRPSRIE
jgi:hypothetical protein